jgi:hypothetical protein
MKTVFLGLMLVSAVLPVEQVTTQSARGTVEGTWSARVAG